MPEITWLPEALEDLARLRLFLEDKNPEAAKRIGQTILAAIARLSQFPLIGKPMNDGTPRRELIAPFGSGAYILRYIADKHTVVIIRVWRSKENRV